MKVSDGLKPRRTVIFYSIALFVIVIFFIVLSLLIDRRGADKVAALNEQNTSALQKIENLKADFERLEQEAAEKDSRIDELELELRELYKDYIEDIKKVEERYNNDYNQLLTQYNDLLNQLESEA